MTLLRCQVVLKHVSGLPRDNVTNTFWVSTPGDTDTPAEAEPIAEVIRNFYTEDVAGLPQPPWAWLGGQIVNNGHEVKVAPIDMATGVDERGEGFPALWTETFDLIGRNPATPLMPSEVAVCLSYKNTTAGAVPPAQRRGRIYFGPLNPSAISNDNGTPRVDFGVRDSLLGASTKLKAQLTALGAGWVIYSRPYPGRPETPRPGNSRGPLRALPERSGMTYLVDAQWVDNAPDTVRKRGERASARAVA